MPEVSFIVPAFNEERLLDGTLQAIVRAASSIPAVNRRQVAATRNAGARAAAGKFLIFVDADTKVTQQVVRAAVAAMRKGAVGGGCTVQFEGRLPLYGRILIALLSPVYRSLGLAAGCFLFCTREAFEAAGGFDESIFAAEEAFLSWALHRQGWFIILRERVVTSGRKLRAYSGREILGGLLRVAVGG